MYNANDLARLEFLAGIENGRQPSPGTGVIANPAQNEATVALPLALSFQRSLLSVENPLQRRKELVGSLPAPVDFFQQEIVVQVQAVGSADRRQFVQRLADHSFGGAVLRHLQNDVGILLVVRGGGGGTHGIGRARSNVLNAVDDQEEHAPLHPALGLLLHTGTGQDRRTLRQVHIVLGGHGAVLERSRRRSGRGSRLHHIEAFLLEFAVDEHRRQGQRLVLVGVQAHVAVARSQVVDGDHSLRRYVVGRDVRHRQTQEGQVAEEDRKFKRILSMIETNSYLRLTK